MVSSGSVYTRDPHGPEGPVIDYREGGGEASKWEGGVKSSYTPTKGGQVKFYPYKKGKGVTYSYARDQYRP